MFEGNLVTVQHLSVSTSAAYSIPVEKNDVLHMIGSSATAHLVRILPEMVFGSMFGASRTLRAATLSDIYDRPEHIWESDTEGAALLSDFYDVSSIVTNAPSLDKTQTDQSHVLEMALDDQDDVFWIPLNQWWGRSGFSRQKNIPAGLNMLLSITHKESNASNAIDWAIRQHAPGAGNDVYWNDTSGTWGSSIAWNAVSGSATVATETFTWSTDTADADNYSLGFRPTADAASEVSRLYQVSCHEVIAASQGFPAGRPAGPPTVIKIPFRAKIGCIAGASSTLYINRLTQSDLK